MEIQHCVILTNEEQGKHLSFVSTAKTHRHHPNKFELVEGGVFSPGKRYASIQRIHYCKNAITEDIASGNDGEPVAKGNLMSTTTSSGLFFPLSYRYSKLHWSDLL